VRIAQRGERALGTLEPPLDARRERREEPPEEWVGAERV
jgi:hypothetical protein